MAGFAAEYRAAREHAACVARTDRALVRVYGRDPVKMIQGLVTNDVAGAPAGQGVYAALLSPRGKMLADLRAFRVREEVLLECAAAALPNVLSTLTRFVPPLFARFEALTDRTILGVYGPAARGVVSGSVAAAPAADAGEDAFTLHTRAEGDVLCARTLYTGDEGFDLIVPAALSASMLEELHAAGATPATLGALDVLRIENGRPVWGAELDEEVIPLEADLRARAISETKGCYTGQEVIVRILHRGHVNRHLRGVLLGSQAPPARGTELFQPADGRKVGTITSACVSPRHGQTIGLAYVRREVTLPAALRLARFDGAGVSVVQLPFAQEH
jgi:folate-binding protein YgfZ